MGDLMHLGGFAGCRRTKQVVRPSDNSLTKGRAASMIRNRRRAVSIVFVVVCITIASIRQHADTGTCGGQVVTLPFGDVSSGNIFFCSIGEAFFSALTNGTIARTYSTAAPVRREQMAAFVTRTMDQSVKRSSRRAALNQYWTTQTSRNFALTVVGSNPLS